MSEFTIEGIEEKTATLESRLKQDRDVWSLKITEIVRNIKDITLLSETQVLMLSYRQMLLDKISDMKGNLYRRNGDYESFYKTRFRFYTLDYDIKLTGGEKDRFVKTDLMPLKRQINILETHLEFYSECIRTLDNMAFAIKNRITLHTNDTL
jgi:hypothetical protein